MEALVMDKMRKFYLFYNEKGGRITCEAWADQKWDRDLRQELVFRATNVGNGKKKQSVPEDEGIGTLTSDATLGPW